MIKIKRACISFLCLNELVLFCKHNLSLSSVISGMIPGLVPGYLGNPVPGYLGNPVPGYLVNQPQLYTGPSVSVVDHIHVVQQPQPNIAIGPFNAAQPSNNQKFGSFISTVPRISRNIALEFEDIGHLSIRDNFSETCSFM